MLPNVVKPEIGEGYLSNLFEVKLLFAIAAHTSDSIFGIAPIKCYGTHYTDTLTILSLWRNRVAVEKIKG